MLTHSAAWPSARQNKVPGHPWLLVQASPRPLTGGPHTPQALIAGALQRTALPAELHAICPVQPSELVQLAPTFGTEGPPQTPHSLGTSWVVHTVPVPIASQT